MTCLSSLTTFPTGGPVALEKKLSEIKWGFRLLTTTQAETNQSGNGKLQDTDFSNLYKKLFLVFVLTHNHCLIPNNWHGSSDMKNEHMDYRFTMFFHWGEPGEPKLPEIKKKKIKAGNKGGLDPEIVCRIEMEEMIHW